MGLVVSMIMITVGAIMRFAVTTQGNGFNVGTVGMILMLVGVLGLVMSIAFWASWGGFNRMAPRRTVAVAEPGIVVGERSTTTVTQRETR